MEHDIALSEILKKAQDEILWAFLADLSLASILLSKLQQIFKQHK